MKNKKTNALSVIGLITSFFSIIISTIICTMALSQIKQSNEKGKGFAIAGIAINLIKIASVLIIFALFLLIPGKSANEYKCSHTTNCTLNSDGITKTCIFEEDGVEEYITCNQPSNKSIDNYGTEENEDTFDYDRNTEE